MSIYAFQGTQFNFKLFPSHCPHTPLPAFPKLCPPQASLLLWKGCLWLDLYLCVFHFYLLSPLCLSLSCTFRTEGGRGGREGKKQECSYLTTLAHSWQLHPWVWQVFKIINSLTGCFEGTLGDPPFPPSLPIIMNLNPTAVYKIKCGMVAVVKGYVFCKEGQTILKLIKGCLLFIIIIIHWQF